MSTVLTSPDLARLRREGFEIEARHGHLLLHNVPYVDSQRRVLRGTLVSTLKLSGDQTVRPDTHVVFFNGEQPCGADGTPITSIVHGKPKRRTLATGISVSRSFSNKPSGGFEDYYAKMTSYARILSGPAEVLDPSVSARTYIVPASTTESVFMYADTASARAEICQVGQTLATQRIAIVGLGGTGSYVLDLVAKTPTSEIHLFDPDWFHQHNAFRAPGAPTLDELRNLPLKVDYLRQRYSNMHRGIHAHGVGIDESNVETLGQFDFVFVCVDRGVVRKLITDALTRLGVAFVDAGMGVHRVENTDSLNGTVRTTASTPEDRSRNASIPTDGAGDDDLYASNIQIADLNCLNAAMAVMQWKRISGFYQDMAPMQAAYLVNAGAVAGS